MKVVQDFVTAVVCTADDRLCAVSLPVRTIRTA